LPGLVDNFKQVSLKPRNPGRDSEHGFDGAKPGQGGD